jgi:3-vinyl bacteriochlorophyllide hydratase
MDIQKKHYSRELMDKRNNSIWTKVQMVLAPLQLLTFFISFALIVNYLTTGDGYTIANASVLLKILLMWLITVTGMFWEKEMYGKWFLAPEFFWEDAFNAVAMFTHNLYFVALFLGWSHDSIMTLMLVAYVTYIINFAQFAYRGWRGHKERVAFQQEAAV